MTHIIEPTVSQGRVEIEFKCTAEPGAKCRLHCPEGCESWTYEGHEHELADSGECMLLPFLDNIDQYDRLECYEGSEGEPLRPGVVELSYHDEYVTWSYPVRENGSAS